MTRRRLGIASLITACVAIVTVLTVCRSSLHWGDVPTWVAAVATVAAAVGAFIAARIAFSQLQDQREQLRQQHMEQQKLALMQDKQVAQLEQQAQLAERQIAQLDRQARSLRRAQADQVTVHRAKRHVTLVVAGPDDYEGAAVTNASARPIWDIHLYRLGADDTHTFARSVRLTPFVGDPRSGEVDLPRAEEVRSLRSGETLYAVWGDLYDEHESVRLRLAFTDDAGVRWEIDQDMHLTELDPVSE